MTRTTIDYGIDLGTTNSAIAVLNGVDADVIKNNAGEETTPSAVYIRENGQLSVGKLAKERSERDPGNTCVEFKLRMGTAGDPKHFCAAGRSMEPEELSAEVLKSLKGDVAQRRDENIDAAVITVPAAFELSACDATKRAAELAGLSHTPLLQEPTAAAFAYGFQSEADNVFWLVYDFGGGTFDAAVVNIRDGELNIVNHRGDRNLGGKLIDWQIVEQLLVPAVIAEGLPFPDLARGNPKTRAAVNALKLAAEKAKIELSRRETTEVTVNLVDDHKRSFEFTPELTRADVDRLAEPFIVRSINMCRKALEESGLGPGDIAKVLLVGGQTLSPYLRERLADPREGLGIAIDHSRDPVTVVARGAAIFAGTQRPPDRPKAAPPAGEYAVELEYSPVGPDTEPFVAGRVNGGSLDGLTIEFVRAGRIEWRSGKITLAVDGAFATTLFAEKGRQNVFLIELTDATGARLKVRPDRLTYTIGVVEPQPPLTDAVGVGLENNEVDWLFERGTPLPATRRASLRTTVGVSRGQGKGMIRIPVLEGEHSRADRNGQIGRLEIEPDQVRRDVPEGSAVELTITIDESRLVVTRAYVPILDEWFEHVLNMQTQTIPDYDQLAQDAAFEKLRLQEVRQRAEEVSDERALAVLRRIDNERIVSEVDTQLEAARVDSDAARECASRILGLKAAIDEVEDALKWPELVHEADELVPAARQLVEARGETRHRSAFATAEAAVRDAISAQDITLLRQRLDELRLVALRILDETGELQYLRFGDLRGMQAEMRDQKEASRLIAEGECAASARDSRALRQVNDQLANMLPAAPSLPDLFSTVRRDR